jgi:hypothetical protein
VWIELGACIVEVWTSIEVTKLAVVSPTELVGPDMRVDVKFRAELVWIVGMMVELLVRLSLIEGLTGGKRATELEACAVEVWTTIEPIELAVLNGNKLVDMDARVGTEFKIELLWRAWTLDGILVEVSRTGGELADG